MDAVCSYQGIGAKVKFILHDLTSSAAGLVATPCSLYVVVAGQGPILNPFTYKKIDVVCNK